MYYGARYYDAALGRFTQPDSIIPNQFNPQSLNRYAYVLNNPLRYTDPTGRCPLCIGTAIGIVVDVGIDFAIAKLTGSSFSPVESLAVNAGINIATAGIGGKVAKLRHLGKLVGLTETGIKYGDGIATTAAKTVGREVTEAVTKSTSRDLAEKLVRGNLSDSEKVDVIRELAKRSVQSPGKDRVVLGSHPEYKQAGGTYFELPSEAWEILRDYPESLWEVNKQFIDDMVDQGMRFETAIDNTRGLGRGIRKELDYLDALIDEGKIWYWEGMYIPQ